MHIIAGYSDGTFGPGKSITREETAKITQKMREIRATLLSTPSI
ncbi:S-layer homology domain-containing protein [Candidatus Peregrinibacteria bacterium]|nr:S-layer homology domain-containing protein [Candidatus Peregrinibacteria bacterium]